MPYTTNDKGNTIWLTPMQERIQEEHYVDIETGEIDKDRFSDGAYKPGRHPNARASQFKKGKDNVNKPGCEGTRTGVKNKKTLRQDAVDAGYMTPAEFLLQVVNDDTVNLNQRLRAAEAARGHYDPSLSSVEMHTDDDNIQPFTLVLNDVDKDDVKTIEEDNKDTDDKEDE